MQYNSCAGDYSGFRCSHLQRDLVKVYQSELNHLQLEQDEEQKTRECLVSFSGQIYNENFTSRPPNTDCFSRR